MEMEILVDSYWDGYHFVGKYIKIRIGYVTYL
ncbi:hypothetical protein HMPREF9449_00839 [Odoribacter laneus YIT 12061]|uniref:Uncharacterized protein n=1 Tax=Odoribacter laneus YIT 12061 TaxID=742817 RepID=H1DF03_9BACT|nr:hypothetical protein HMPREF9449_00839 [Odoribacter laneus YIT 12061]